MWNKPNKHADNLDQLFNLPDTSHRLRNVSCETYLRAVCQNIGLMVSCHFQDHLASLVTDSECLACKKGIPETLSE